MMDYHTGVDKRLSQLGHSQDLRRRLHVWHVVGLALALISPTVTVVLLATAIFAVSGTFAVGASLVISLVAVPIALILAELGAMCPLAGGIYSLTRHVLPGPFMWITAFNILLIGLIFLAVSGLGIVPFLKSLLPAIQLPDPVIAFMILMIATAIAIIRVELGAIINAVLIVVECIALGTIIAAGLFHPHQSLTAILVHPTMLTGSELTPVTTSIVLATLPAAFIMISGYEIVLGFSEELVGDTKALARAVIATAILAIALILIPLTAAVVAAPNLVAFLQSPTPVVYSVQQAFGSGTATLINTCICVALFTAMVATLMYFPRVLFATGRDGMWPSGVANRLSALNRYHVPGTAVLVMAFISLLLIFVSPLNWLVIFMGTCVTIVYFMVGLMGFWSRLKYSKEPRPYRMPLWPMVPIVVMLFTAFALINQDPQYLVGSVILNGAAVLAWALRQRYSP
jgi:amino acid transporter